MTNENECNTEQSCEVNAAHLIPNKVRRISSNILIFYHFTVIRWISCLLFLLVKITSLLSQGNCLIIWKAPACGPRL